MKGRHTFTIHDVSVRYIIEGSNTVEEYSSPTDVSPLLQSMKLILQTRKDSEHAGHSECYDLSPCSCQMRTLPWAHAAGFKSSGRTRNGNYRYAKVLRRSSTALGKSSGLRHASLF